MQTARTLPPDTWSSFLEELSEERRGAPVLLVVDWAALGEEVEAHHVLLQALTYDTRSDAIVVAMLRPSTAGPTVLRHVVARPTSIAVDSPAGILPRELHIESAEGPRTIVRLDPQPQESS